MERMIRRSKTEDFDTIMEIYARARAFMAANGNPTQWGDASPGEQLVRSDIENNGYVVVEGAHVVGAFYFEENAYEPVYDSIEGAWPDDKPYAVIHRCAVRDNARGVGQFIFDWCLSKSDSVRIDTHENNTPMKNLISKNGFNYCGKVQYEKPDGERIAYQKCGE